MFKKWCLTILEKFYDNDLRIWGTFLIFLRLFINKKYINKEVDFLKKKPNLS